MILPILAGRRGHARGRAGHPLHALAVHLPLGLWTFAALADAVGPRHPLAPALAQGCLAAGLVAAVPALVTGLLDYGRLPVGSPAETAAQRHLALVLAATGLFALSMAWRAASGGAGGAPEGARAASLLGLLALLPGAYYGGELVFRHGIGVRRADDGSGPEAGGT